MTLSATPCKSHMANHILFQFLSIFLYDFCVSHQLADLESTREVCLKYNIYLYIRHMYIIISCYYFENIILGYD